MNFLKIITVTLMKLILISTKCTCCIWPAFFNVPVMETFPFRITEKSLHLIFLMRGKPCKNMFATKDVLFLSFLILVLFFSYFQWKKSIDDIYILRMQDNSLKLKLNCSCLLRSQYKLYFSDNNAYPFTQIIS